MPPFLITTAEQSFWRQGSPTLFLGEWCRLYKEKKAWEPLAGKLLPYHWDDRARLAEDFSYLNGVHERVLEALATVLNGTHGTDYPISFWRVLLGPWLVYGIPSLFDRFESISRARDAYPDFHTVIPRRQNGAPKDFAEFGDWILTDRYNLFVYGEIVRFLGGIAFEEQELPLPSPPGPVSLKGRLRERAKSAISVAGRLAPGKVFFAYSYFPRWALARLQLSLGQVPVPDAVDGTSPAAEIDRPRRAAFCEALEKAMPTDKPFEKFLIGFLGSQIPRSYLEGFTSLKEAALKRFPKKVSVIVTANGHTNHDVFKFWSGLQILGGARFAVLQHGGHFGTGWCATEQQDLAVCDRYYSWGWESEGKVRGLPASKLIVRQKPRSNNQGSILLASNSIHRYANRLYSVPIANQMLSSIQAEVDFLKACPEILRPLLEVRLYPVDLGWNQAERMRDAVPWIRFAPTDIPFRKYLENCRLCLSTQNTTVPLESLVADCPSILFWDPHHWELRESAKPYFDELREAGILHDTPVSAAEQVKKIWEDPETWWNSSQVKKTRDRFCRQFAYTNGDWKQIWKEELRSLYLTGAPNPKAVPTFARPG